MKKLHANATVEQMAIVAAIGMDVGTVWAFWMAETTTPTAALMPN